MLNLVVRRYSLGAEVAPEPCLTAWLRSGEGRIPQVQSLLQSALLAIVTPLSAGDADVQCFLCCSGRLDLTCSSKQLSVRFRAELVPNGGAVPNSAVFSSGGTSRLEDLARKSTPGTLWGVYMPCLQCTLGIILFLRLPWITAQAGAVQATLIVTMCVAVAALTALSISAIVTNEVGAAVGVLLYVGWTMGCAMCVLGAVEAFQKAFGLEGQFGFDTQVEALGVLLIVATVATVGARSLYTAARLFLGVVLLSFLCFLVGMVVFIAGGSLNGTSSLGASDREEFGSVGASYEEDPETGLTPSFFSLLALFFPSVTGITVGLSRSPSRDLGQSLPRGILAAVATGSVVFLGTVWLFGAVVSSDTLKSNKLAVAAAAWPHPLVANVGIPVIAFGAAVQCLARGGRLLAAIGQEATVPMLISYAAEPDTTPQRAIGLTWLLASLACLSGNLDFLAPIASITFLLAFATINFACFVLIVLQQPTFRPMWPYFHWGTALAGSMSSVVLMMGISWYWGLVAVFLTLALYVYVSFSDAIVGWGNVRDGMRFKLARDSLLAMREHEELHPQKWVPQLLVVVELDKEEGAPLEAQEPLLDLAVQLKKGRGLTVVSGIILRGGDLQLMGPQMQSLKKGLQRRSESHGLLGMASVGTAASYQEGVWAAVQHSGLGPMQANVVMLPWLVGGAEQWREDPEAADNYIRTLRGVTSAARSLAILKLGEGASFPGPTEQEAGTIDVWWIAHDLSLIFFLARQLGRHRAWRRCKLRLFTVAADQGSGVTLERSLSDHLDILQINAEVNVVTMEAQDMLDSRAISQRTLDEETRKQLLRQLGQEDATLTMVARRDVAGHRGSGSRTEDTSALSSLFDTVEKEEAEEGAEARVDLSTEQQSRAGSVDEEQAYQDAGDEGGDRPVTGDGATRRKEAQPADEVKRADTDGAKATAGAGDDVAGDASAEVSVAPAERLSMAAKMNATICSWSQDASLVVMNVPFGRDINGQRIIEHIEVLTEGLTRALLVRGCGREVVTDL